MLELVSCLTANMFTLVGCVVIRGWRREWDVEKVGSYNALLLTVFEKLFITREFTDMKLSSIVSLVLWGIK